MSFSHLPWLAFASLEGIRPVQSALWTERECTWQSTGQSGARVALPQSPILRMALEVEHSPARMSRRRLQIQP